MSNKFEIVVTDWIKQNLNEGNFLKLTLSSEQRRVFRGKRRSDCNKELQLQLPREGKLNDGDILSTNHENLFIKIIAKKENLIKITAETNLELVKVAYHLGNRHVEIEINENLLYFQNHLNSSFLNNFPILQNNKTLPQVNLG